MQSKKIEFGICTEDAECNLRGVKVIFNLFVIVIVVCKVVIPSREKLYFKFYLNIFKRLIINAIPKITVLKICLNSKIMQNYSNKPNVRF